MTQNDFSETLKALRKKKKMTQQALSDRSGLSLRYLQELEAGPKQPTIETLFKLAYGLDTTPDKLIKKAWEAWLQDQGENQ